MDVVGKGCSGDLSDKQGQILQCHEPFFQLEVWLAEEATSLV